nr:autotransporter domain-containing protein [Pelagibacterium xiamenense]
MATTALVSLLPAAVFAQEIIDGGTTETVIGGGSGTQASPWNILDQLYVGDNSTGVLEISNGGAGGSVTSYESFIGRTLTGDGAVSVDGAGSDWTSNSQIWVGYDGVGELTISDGASVSDTTGNIAFGTTSTGTVVVTGGGSWEHTNSLYISEGGTGYLTVSDGGSVSVGPVGGAIRIANDAGAYGEATVTGAASVLDVADGTLTVGYGGTGVLYIRDAATVAADDGFIGHNGTAAGTVTIESGGLLDLSASGSDLTIARSSGSEGTLRIADGLADIGATTTLGDQAGAEGTIEVTSASGQLATRNIFIGDAGTGTLSITDGTATVDVDMTVGAQTGSDGRVVNDGGTLNIGFDLSVGDSGTGVMTVENGGTLTTGGFANIGEIGGMGTLTVTGGSAWDTGNNTYVGTGGAGNIIISNGAVVNDSGFALILGSHDSSGSGTLEVNDAAWNTVGQVSLGGDVGSRGELTLAAGGTLSSNDHIFVGDLGDGVGTITGAGSELTATGGLYLGNSAGGTGQLTIAEGGQAVIDNDIAIAADSGTLGTVNVTGGGSYMEAGNELLVGDIGAGTLNIIDGSVHADSTIYLGYDADGQGTVLVRGASANLSSNSWLIIAEDGTGVLTIADGGTVSVSGRAYLGYDASSDGTLNIGAAGGAAAQGAGTLDAAELWFGDHEDAKLVFNHTDDAYAFDADMIGEGRIYHAAGETLLGGDSSGFSGVTSITGGALRVNGSLGGNVVALDGGVLGGSGTLSGLVAMQAGGVLAPGNSIGTTHVGTIIFNPGSVYEVELDDGGFSAGINNDLLDASGAVTINGGTIHVTPENGSDDGSSYAAPGTYTIITASSVSGTFDDVSDDYIFLDFTDRYDATGVYLISEQVAYFSQIAETPNQQAVAPAVEALGDGNAVYDALVGLAGSEDDARAALDSLTGEIHVSAQTALLEDSRFPREAAMDRLRVTLGGVGADATAQIADPVSENFGIWGQGFGGWSRWDSDGNAAAMNRTIGGFVMGGDALVLDTARIGVLGGYSRSTFSVSDRVSSGTADTYTLGAYGGGEWGALTLTGGLAHSWHSLDTTRSTDISGFSDSLTASYNARTLQAWGEAAYSFEAGAARFEPFANLAYVSLATDGFTESGGAAALSAASNVVDATFTTLGLRAETDIAFGETDATLRGTVGWRHAFGGAPASQLSFASSGDAFTIAGVPLGRDTLVLEAGIDLNLADEATMSFAYGGQFGSGVQDHSATARLNVRF